MATNEPRLDEDLIPEAKKLPGPTPSTPSALSPEQKRYLDDLMGGLIENDAERYQRIDRDIDMLRDIAKNDPTALWLVLGEAARQKGNLDDEDFERIHDHISAALRRNVNFIPPEGKIRLPELEDEKPASAVDLLAPMKGLTRTPEIAGEFPDAMSIEAQLAHHLGRQRKLERIATFVTGMFVGAATLMGYAWVHVTKHPGVTPQQVKATLRDPNLLKDLSEELRNDPELDEALESGDPKEKAAALSELQGMFERSLQRTLNKHMNVDPVVPAPPRDLDRLIR